MQLLEKLSAGIVEKSMKKETEALVNKWKQTGLLEGLRSDMSRRNMAILLENQIKQLLKEATTMAAGDVEGYAQSAFPIVRRVFGELLANKLVSVQAMSMPTSQIFFLDVVYENNRLGHVSGESVYGQGVVGQQISGGVITTGSYVEKSFWALNNGYSSPTASNVTITVTAVASGTFGAGTAVGDGQTLDSLCRFDPDLTSGTTKVAVGKIAATDLNTGGNTMNFYDLVTLCLHTGSTFGGLTLATGSQVRRLTQWSGSGHTSGQVLEFLLS